jgi:adenosine kinase
VSTSGRIIGRGDGASFTGAPVCARRGTQNQRFDYEEFAEQFKQQFGYAL